MTEILEEDLKFRKEDAKIIGIGETGKKIISNIKLQLKNIEIDYISKDNLNIGEFKNSIKDLKILFFTLSLSDEKGRELLTELSKVYKNLGILTIAIVINDEDFDENNIKNSVNSLILIPKKDLHLIEEGINEILNIVFKVKLIDLDIVDIKNALSNSEISIIKIGRGKGKDRATECIEDISKKSNLINNSITTTKIIFNISAASSLGLSEALIISNGVKKLFNPTKEIMMSITNDENMGDNLKVFLIAIGVTK